MINCNRAVMRRLFNYVKEIRQKLNMSVEETYLEFCQNAIDEMGIENMREPIAETHLLDDKTILGRWFKKKETK